MNLFTKQKKTQTQRMNLWLPGVKGYLGVWDGHVHTAIFKMDN